MNKKVIIYANKQMLLITAQGVTGESAFYINNGPVSVSNFDDPLLGKLVIDAFPFSISKLPFPHFRSDFDLLHSPLLKASSLKTFTGLCKKFDSFELLEDAEKGTIVVSMYGRLKRSSDDSKLLEAIECPKEADLISRALNDLFARNS